LYTSGRVRITTKFGRIMTIAFVGYALFSVVNFALTMFTPMDGFGIRSLEIPGTSIPWGVPIGIFAVLLASFMLVRDFQFVDEGVKNRIPAKNEWIAAYGIVFTIIWLYIEILRLLAIFRGR